QRVEPRDERHRALDHLAAEDGVLHQAVGRGAVEPEAAGLLDGLRDQVADEVVEALLVAGRGLHVGGLPVVADGPDQRVHRVHDLVRHVRPGDEPEVGALRGDGHQVALAGAPARVACSTACARSTIWALRTTSSPTWAMGTPASSAWAARLGSQRTQAATPS